MLAVFYSLLFNFTLSSPIIPMAHTAWETLIGGGGGDSGASRLLAQQLSHIPHTF